MNFNTTIAVFKRNFFAYFSSPTGYVFICVFVLLSAFSAFWPAAFFNMNLANLGQLNKVFPFIMLIFIPAITMSCWAEERRLGTDELLLTLPAKDTDITAGKFLAAVGIYTASLLFSAICLLSVLSWLGNPDIGLFCSTFFGYWLIGIAMCAVGMVTSFLTSNLTMAYIFGVLLNAPLVFAAWGANLFSPEAGKWIAQWSYGNQFEPFGRGLLTFSSTLYFIAVAVVMLYVCMILISRRHWSGGNGGWNHAIHYTIRTVCLIAIAAGLVAVVRVHDFQLDFTVEKLNSMAPETKTLIDSIKPERPVKIEAYISPEVPQRYVQTKLQMERLLHEIQTRGGNRIEVNFHYISPLTEQALLAEKQYGIRPKSVSELSRELVSTEDIFLSAAFTSGMEQVIIPFIDPGMSVDYELSQALATVSQKQRKRIGVVRTDAQIFSGIDFQSMRPSPDWLIIDQLKSTYNIEEVSPQEKINPADWDALICVQPSSMGPQEMDNFLDVIRAGVPTAIFEDPVLVYASDIPGTTEPRRPPGNAMMAMMMQQQSPPKCDITKLWNLLGVEFTGDGCLAQSYNPIPMFTDMPPEFIFIDKGAGEPKPFNSDSPATSLLQRVLLPAPGAITLINDVKTQAKETARNLEQSFLMRTGPKAGIIPGERLFLVNRLGTRAGINVQAKPDPSTGDLITAAWIRGKNWKRPASVGQDNQKKSDKTEESVSSDDNINVVLTADVDLLHDAFFQLRNQVLEDDFRFDNVAYVLNVIDLMAGEDSFCRIRSIRPQHRTLTRITNLTKVAREKKDKASSALEKEYQQKIADEKIRIENETKKLNKQIQEQGLDMNEIRQRVELLRNDMNKRMESQQQQFSRDKQRKIQRLETELRTEINRAQDRCKMLAVVLPPILPLILAVIVFIYRRCAEYEGVNKRRTRNSR